MKVRLDRYRHDATVKELIPNEVSESGGGSERGEVKEFSFKSRQRLAFTALNTDVKWSSMLTLTYQADVAPVSGKVAKGHLNAFLKGLRDRHPGCSYLWFMEFTRRGSAHFHILTNVKPGGRERIQKGGVRMCYDATLWASERWAGIARTTGNFTESMRRVCARWELSRDAEGLSRYAVKYAYKMEQKEVPEGFENVGRMWGTSRDVKPQVKTSVTIECETWEEARELFSTWKDPDGNERFYRVQFAQGMTKDDEKKAVPDG
jgi:hypothetical protein